LSATPTIYNSVGSYNLIILGHTAVISIDDVSDLALPGSDHSVMPF